MNLGPVLPRPTLISFCFILNLTGVAETGDVLLTCAFGKMIDIIDIKINDTELSQENEETTKQECAMKMIQGTLRLGNPRPQAQTPSPHPKKHVSCTVLRQGLNGKLVVKYQCLKAPHIPVSDQQLTQKIEKPRQRLLVFKKSKLRKSNYQHRFPKKNERN